MLAGALGQKVVAHGGATQKKAVPGLAQGGDDALVAFDANLDFLDTLWQTHVQRETNGLGAVVDENSADGHGDPLKKCIWRLYIAGQRQAMRLFTV